MTRDVNFLAAHGDPRAPLAVYSADELRDPKQVEELFDYCQILQGVISAAGWRHLLEVHGLDALLAIDRRSGWLDADESAAADALKYQCLISGYDPETDCFGSYDETAGTFASSDGRVRAIEWTRAWTPAVAKPQS